MQVTRDALLNFTHRYLHAWKQHANRWPTSRELYRVPSPCVVETVDKQVCWQPQLPLANQNLSSVAQGMELELHPSIIGFYSSQLAGDMQACFNGRAIELLQVWSEDDLRRLQFNLIGHLVMKKRLRQPASLFIATTSDESEAICVDNLTGEVVLERQGRKFEREILAEQLASFLLDLQPKVVDYGLNE